MYAQPQRRGLSLKGLWILIDRNWEKRIYLCHHSLKLEATLARIRFIGRLFPDSKIPLLLYFKTLGAARIP